MTATASRQTALVTELQSQSDVLSHSDGNTTIEGSRIASGTGQVTIKAGGKLDIRTAESTSPVGMTSNKGNVIKHIISRTISQKFEYMPKIFKMHCLVPTIKLCLPIFICRPLSKTGRCDVD